MKSQRDRWVPELTRTHFSIGTLQICAGAYCGNHGAVNHVRFITAAPVSTSLCRPDQVKLAV